MKAKKTKGFKKNLSFYRINFSFQPPYQLVFDGNFIKQMLDHNVDLDKQLFKHTKAKIWKHTTICVLRELTSLQHLFPRVFKYAQGLSKINCKHIEGVSPAECLLDIVKPKPEFGGDNNYFWICTQDDELRSNLLQIDHVPVCYLFQNNLFEMAEPSRTCKMRIKSLKEIKYLPNEQEKQIIMPIKKEIKQQQAEKRMEKERKLAQELAIKIKKPAKGPNPLSVKKKLGKVTKSIKKRRHKIKNKKSRRSNKQGVNNEIIEQNS
ncbi:unnamed protein product [Paramecium octaurelia]|uniref:UTP23 sensor motif region domain-containing protein n=1 Tax=Paramecium octaurelia TaxID=43137 RepID=A0A8S1T7R9_PAROT|nr:unnamed protein product [Paramecium octaurelia]